MSEERTEPSASSAPAGEIDVPPTVVATTTIAVNRRLGRSATTNPVRHVMQPARAKPKQSSPHSR
jgi:hypothetical protein